MGLNLTSRLEIGYFSWLSCHVGTTNTVQNVPSAPSASPGDSPSRVSGDRGETVCIVQSRLFMIMLSSLISSPTSCLWQDRLTHHPPRTSSVWLQSFTTFMADTSRLSGSCKRKEDLREWQKDFQELNS